MADDEKMEGGGDRWALTTEQCLAEEGSVAAMALGWGDGW